MYIFPNGDYFFGDLVNNHAETFNGEYYSSSITYKGGFKDNKFHG